MHIIEKIAHIAVEFENTTGKKPTNVYIGILDMGDLLIWAEKSGYIPKAKDASITGENRPEVNGLFVYEVNDLKHMGCS